MDACPLLITSIVAVKPEDQGTFFQDFWAYLVIFAPLVDSILTLPCSVPEMLRTTMKPNGLRYPRVGGTRSRRFAGTSLEPRKLPENAQTPTSRVHAVLGNLAPTRTMIEKRHHYQHTKFSYPT